MRKATYKAFQLAVAYIRDDGSEQSKVNTKFCMTGMSAQAIQRAQRLSNKIKHYMQSEDISDVLEVNTLKFSIWQQGKTAPDFKRVTKKERLDLGISERANVVRII